VGPGAGRPTPAADFTFAVLHGLFWLLANLAERAPVVFCVDDLQWIDAPSMRFLDYVAVRLDGMPVLGLFTARAGDAALTRGMVARLAQHADVHSMPVGPLGPDAVADIVRTTLGPDASDELIEACQCVTGGNPFLLRELAGELRRAGGTPDPTAIRRLAPPAIVRAVRLRLEAMPAEAIAVARAVAVLGDGCDVAAAAELGGLELHAARRAAEQLAEADILERGHPLRFAHPVVRSSARESIPASEMGELRRRAADIAALGPDGLDAAAGHLLAADPRGDAAVVELLRRAAAVARRRGAADAASTYLRRALAEPPPPARLPGVLVELAGASGTAAEPDALVFAERALALAEDAAEQLDAATELALLHILAGRPEAAAAALAQVVDRPDLPAERRPGAEVMLLLVAGQSADARGRHRERLEAVLAQVDRLAADAPAALLVLAGFELALVEGEPERGAVLVERAIAGNRLLRETTAHSPHPIVAIDALMTAGRYRVAETMASDTIADAAARGSIRTYAMATAQRGLCRARAGRLPSAEADARAAGHPREGRSLTQLAMSGATLAIVMRERGDLAAADAAIADIPFEAARPDTHLGCLVVRTRARVRMAQGRWRDALMDLEACGEWERRFGVRHGGWTAWRALAAEARQAVGETEAARAIAAEGVELARALGVARTLGLSLRGAALVGVGDDAEALLLEAAEVFESGGVANELARTLTDIGERREAGGRFDDARETLQRALELAEDCGATVTAQRARNALVRAGARPRRRTVSGFASLTPSERRVAELAAGGASNKEIAEQLFLTLKTVENHLTNAYRKLGIRSRTQLAQHLG
jgi:DNA-binding CsgD family transcriptional regulator